MKFLISVLATIVTLTSGVIILLNPFWWTKNKINSFSKVNLNWSKKTSFLYRLDILFQNIFGYENKLLRHSWIKKIESEYLQKQFSGPRVALPEFDWNNRPLKEFETNYRLKQHPVVLRNYLAKDEDYSKWDIDELIAEFGNEEVTLTCPVFDGYQGKLNEINIDGVYLHNSEILLKKHPELHKKMGFNLIASELAKDLMFSGVAQLFAGRKKTGTWWHCAGGMNIFLMLEGQKKWSFIDPEFSPLMFPKSVGTGASAYYISEAGISSNVYKNNFEKLSSKDKDSINDSQKSFISPKMKELFESVSRYEVVLNPGDVLLIPAWWWHDVENITDSTVAVASRWFDPSRPKLSNTIFDVGTRLNPDFFMTAIGAALSQTLVNKDRTLNLKSTNLKEHLTMRTRANNMSNYGKVNEDINLYYKRFGLDRNTLQEQNLHS